MKRYRLSNLARTDLESIWEYSAEHWGSTQAEAYLRDLHRVIESTANNPLLGRPCDEIRAGYFKRAAGSHILFYQRVGASIDIIRILHQRMDFDRHL